MPKLFRFKDLAGEGVPYCRCISTGWSRLTSSPKRIRLGPNTGAWLAGEVRGYVEEKIAVAIIRAIQRSWRAKRGPRWPIAAKHGNGEP